MKMTHHDKKGFALFTVLFFIAAISLMLGMLIRLSGQRAFTAKRLTNKVKALAYAEAGIDYAYSILSVDFDQRNNPSAFVLNPVGTNSTVSTYAEGTFELTVTPISNKYVVVNCVGTCGEASETAEILVDDENAGSGGILPDYSNMEGFNYAVLSGGTFDFGGSGTLGEPGAKLHSNSPINIKGSANTEVSISSHTTIAIGNNKTITGDVTTPDPNWKPSKVTITGTATKKSVPPVEIPDVDLTPYFNWAKKHGQVYGTGDTLPKNPAGGVIWVNGDVQLTQGPYNGSIIATGDIHISGGGGMDITSTTTAFAIASRDGDINITTSSTIKGLVYAKNGNYSQTANGRLEGQLIVNGTIKKGGNSDIIVYKRSVPSDPDPSSTDPVDAWPVVAAWQK